MERYIILSEKTWHKNIIKNIASNFEKTEWYFIDNKLDFNFKNIKNINPTKIFIPHWSYIIKKEIFSEFDCVVFHMTDLPFGRGGSPLQNLIIRGFNKTKITALKIDEGIDTGDIYLKKDCSLDGSARIIFERAAIIVENMITEIIKKNIKPVPQSGEIIEFSRRKPNESDIFKINDIKLMFDYIRMLDCDGYPHAYIETDSFKIEFSNAELKSKNNLEANVRIFKK